MIAYFILVHRYPIQFKRLFKAIYSSENLYVIHIDKKASLELADEVRLFLSQYSNVQIMKSQNVVWGGYSMVDVELKGMQLLLKMSNQWEFFINLSGQDFPLKSQADIRDFLRDNPGRSFLKIIDQVKERPITLNRITNFFIETGRGFIGTPIKRAFMPKVTPYIGGQWKILSRECCEFICHSPQVSKFKNFYKHTLIADESFFQTVLMNTTFSGELINNDKRAIIWVPDLMRKLRSKKFANNSTQSLIDSGEIKLRPKIFSMTDVDFLMSSEALFARKFDATVDNQIFDVLEEKLFSILPLIPILKQELRAVPQLVPKVWSTASFA